MQVKVKILKDEEKKFAIWLGNYRNGLYKDKFVSGQMVDGIIIREILDDKEWHLWDKI